MTDNYSQLAGKQLSKILFFGTHDSGMSELHGTHANVGAQGTTTQTQTLTIGEQITVAGARYLDIRPVYYEADDLSDVPSGYYTAHWSTPKENVWFGLVGRSLANVCQDLATAMSTIGKGEVVLLENPMSEAQSMMRPTILGWVVMFAPLVIEIFSVKLLVSRSASLLSARHL